MTLTTRIVAALVLAALIPMAVVLAVPLFQAEQRAEAETADRRSRTQTTVTQLVEQKAAETRREADRAAAALAENHSALAAVFRGPQSVALSGAAALAATLAERFGFDRVEILGFPGIPPTVFGGSAIPPDAVTLTERRSVPTENEALALVMTTVVGTDFAADVAAITGGETRLSRNGHPICREPFVEVPVGAEAVLCVEVAAADAGKLRQDLLGSFARVAPVAFLAALAVGLVLAARITRPVRDLAERAESISTQRSGSITLLPEKDETRRMTVAFDQMLDALEMSERQRLAAERVAAWEEIAKRLAHEIKNPLSPIQLAVENLERTRKLAPQAFDQAFDVETRTIKEEVRSLRVLVDEFAQFARLPRPHLAPCDPRAVVEQALALYAGRIEEMSVVVSVDAGSAPPTIHADAEQIGRVLKNVIANALDAMEETADRRLFITLSSRGNQAVFAVRDNGRGFDQETLRRVFEPYFTTRAGRGGTGLGMAIARRIAVEHGGTLHAEGVSGKGATITLTVPVKGPPLT